MSRSGYSEDCGGWDLIRWRGAVNSAIRGKRGQALLQELADGLDAMPVKELVSSAFEENGCMCALGVVGAKRGMDLSALDIEDSEQVANAFGIAKALAAEVMHINDESGDYWGRWSASNDHGEDRVRADREKRWRDVRAWVAGRLAPAAFPTTKEGMD